MSNLKKLLIFIGVSMVIAVTVILIANPAVVKNVINNIFGQALELLGTTRFDILP